MKSGSLMPSRIISDAVLPRRSVSDGQFLDPGDPAIHAVTDFTREHPVTVDEERQIDDALMGRGALKRLLHLEPAKPHVSGSQLSAHRNTRRGRVPDGAALHSSRLCGSNYRLMSW